VKHCQLSLPSFVTGQLLGLDIGRSLEITNTFPFPTADRGESNDEDLTEYQMEMMRCLREVNVDNNTVGWYQSTYFSSFIDEACVETQYNYQRNIKRAVVIVYDPSQARTSGIALRAFRLSETFMQLYAQGKVTSDAVVNANRVAGADVFEELPITVRNSHLNSALLLEMQDECSDECALAWSHGGSNTFCTLRWPSSKLRQILACASATARAHEHDHAMLYLTSSSGVCDFHAVRKFPNSRGWSLIRILSWRSSCNCSSIALRTFKWNRTNCMSMSVPSSVNRRPRLRSLQKGVRMPPHAALMVKSNP